MFSLLVLKNGVFTSGANDECFTSDAQDGFFYFWCSRRVFSLLVLKKDVFTSGAKEGCFHFW